MGRTGSRDAPDCLSCSHLSHFETVQDTVAMKQTRIVFRNVFEGAVFLLTVIFLFNTFTDFATTIEFVEQPLPLMHIQYFGFAAAFTAALNWWTDKFLGLELVR
jgi:hypothetical protein